MTDGVIGIALKWDGGIVLLHPFVKRVVQKEVGKNRTYDRALWDSHGAFYDFSLARLIWYFEPSADIEQYPFLLDMYLDCLHEQFVVNGVEELGYVHVEYPSILKASLTCLGYGIVCGKVMAITIRVIDKVRFDEGFNEHYCRLLCHSVFYRWDA